MSDVELVSGEIPLRTKVGPEALYAGMDPGIRFAVRVLNAHGIETCQSCEGSDGHAYPEPTVDMLAGPHDSTGFHALALLHAFGLPVSSVGMVWYVANGLPFEPVWRVTFAKPFPERADEELMFLWGYQARVLSSDSAE